VWRGLHDKKAKKLAFFLVSSLERREERKQEVGGVIDQTCIGTTSYEGGWARRSLDLPATPPHRDLGHGNDEGQEAPYFNSDITRPADIPWSLFTCRRGGNARFPEVKPMWFAYRIPISGRTPCQARQTSPTDPEQGGGSSA
jgi:hypothetical protein